MTISRSRKVHGIDFSWKSILKIGCVLAFCGLVFLCISQYKTSKLFPIKVVKVSGAHFIDHATIQHLLTPLVSHGFFSTDVSVMKEQLKQLPWVSEVSIRRIWPDQVLIHVSEKKPIAAWNKSTLLSDEGILFPAGNVTLPSELPTFLGPDGSQILMMDYYKSISQLLNPLHFKITQLELTPASSWILTLNNGMKLSLGHKDILTRLSHFVKVYPKIVGDRYAEVEYIDLRYSNGMAVKWKSIT